MPIGYDGLPPSYIGKGSPLTPHVGLSVFGMDPVLAENMFLIDSAVGAGGTSVFVNAVSVSNPNFNDTTPTAPVGFTNVTWKVSGANVSAYVPNGTPGGNNTDIQYNDGGVFGGDDGLTWNKTTKALLALNSTSDSSPITGQVQALTDFQFSTLVAISAQASTANALNPINVGGLTGINITTIVDEQNGGSSVVGTVTGLNITSFIHGSGEAGGYLGIAIGSPIVQGLLSGSAIGLKIFDYSFNGSYTGRSILTTQGIVEFQDKFMLSGKLVDSTDISKQVSLNLANITPSTTRTVNFPDATSSTAVSNAGGAGLALATFNSSTGLFTTVAVGSGTVTSFSAGALSPLFTTSVGTATTTPALTFSLTNAAGGTVFGNNTTSSAAPAYTTAPVLGIPGTSTGSVALASATASGKFTLTAPANAATPTLTLPTTSNVLAGQFAGDGTVLSSTLAVASAAGTVTAALANAGGGTVLGNATTSSATPTYTIAPVFGIPGTSTGSIALASSTASGKFTLTAPASASTPTLTLPTTANVLAGQLAGDNVIYATTLQVASAAGTLTIPTPQNQNVNIVFAGPSSGGAATPGFRALVAADIPNSTITPIWNNLQNATGALTLANAGNATTFNQTSAVSWTWANTTAATSGTSQSSPLLSLNGTFWNGASSATDSWTIQDVVTNGTNGVSTLTFTHAGTTGLPKWSVSAGSGSTFAFGNCVLGTGAWQSFANSNYAGMQAADIVLFGTTLIGMTNTGASVPLVWDGTKQTKYNSISLVGNGIPTEVATVDSTGLVASTGTLTLYAVPAAGAGQYRVSWNAKITTAGTSPVIGPLTLTYTDPDGTACAMIIPSSNSAGTTSASGNAANSTTATGVMLGCNVLLNCKLSTNIQYSFPVSGTIGSGAWNLHIKCEAMG